jgi:hypothetical protein
MPLPSFFNPQNSRSSSVKLSSVSPHRLLLNVFDSSSLCTYLVFCFLH